MTGLAIAIFGAALCAALAGCGSAIGVMAAGKAAAGVTSQKPELFGKLLVLQALPGTQGIYGFLTAILIMVRLGLLGAAPWTFPIQWAGSSSLPLCPWACAG